MPLFFTEPYTIESVKEKLPDIQIRINGRVYWAQIAGRELQFACVFADPFNSLQFSWQAICNCLNAGDVLEA